MRNGFNDVSCATQPNADGQVINIRPVLIKVSKQALAVFLQIFPRNQCRVKLAPFAYKFMQIIFHFNYKFSVEEHYYESKTLKPINYVFLSFHPTVTHIVTLVKRHLKDFLISFLLEQSKQKRKFYSRM